MRTSLTLFGLALTACASANGYDPARVSQDQPGAAGDPEVEPLPPSAKRVMRDPRGIPDSVAALADAGSAMPDGATSAAEAGSAATASVVMTAGCGSKTVPCPLQRFMRLDMATAHTEGTLAAAFTRVARMSPDSTWSWVAIATRGAERANAGDLAGAKAQCAACHDAYREAYRARHRARAL